MKELTGGNEFGCGFLMIAIGILALIFFPITIVYVFYVAARDIANGKFASWETSRKVSLTILVIILLLFVGCGMISVVVDDIQRYQSNQNGKTVTAYPFATLSSEHKNQVTK